MQTIYTCKHMQKTVKTTTTLTGAWFSRFLPKREVPVIWSVGDTHYTHPDNEEELAATLLNSGFEVRVFQAD